MATPSIDLAPQGAGAAVSTRSGARRLGAHLTALVMAFALVLSLGTTAEAAPAQAFSVVTAVGMQVPSAMSTPEAGAQPKELAAANPVLIAAAVYYLKVYGVYALRYIPQVIQVFQSYWMRRAACQQLRREGNWWGWSWVCAGT